MVLNVLCGWLIGEHCKTPVRGFVYQGSTKYDLIVTDWEVANVAIFHINLVWLFRLNPTLFLAGGSQPQEPQCQELLGRYIKSNLVSFGRYNIWRCLKTHDLTTCFDSRILDGLSRQSTDMFRISQCQNITPTGPYFALPWLGWVGGTPISY